MLLRQTLTSLQACLMLLCFTTMPSGAQEAPTWEQQATGSTTISRLGKLHYTVGYSSAGFDHFNSAITVKWQDRGEQEQTIYEGIYDKPPAKVWGSGRHLCIAMQACARYSDRCNQHVIAHRYDTQGKAFVALKSEKTAHRICRAPR